jgi:hypothetical protein
LPLAGRAGIGGRRPSTPPSTGGSDAMAMDLSPGPLLPRLGIMSAAQTSLMTPTPQVATAMPAWHGRCSCARLLETATRHALRPQVHFCTSYLGWCCSIKDTALQPYHAG